MSSTQPDQPEGDDEIALQQDIAFAVKLAKRLTTRLTDQGYTLVKIGEVPEWMEQAGLDGKAGECAGCGLVHDYIDRPTGHRDPLGLSDCVGSNTNGAVHPVYRLREA